MNYSFFLHYFPFFPVVSSQIWEINISIILFSSWWKDKMESSATSEHVWCKIMWRVGVLGSWTKSASWFPSGTHKCLAHAWSLLSVVTWVRTASFAMIKVLALKYHPLSSCTCVYRYVLQIMNLFPWSSGSLIIKTALFSSLKSLLLRLLRKMKLIQTI